MKNSAFSGVRWRLMLSFSLLIIASAAALNLHLRRFEVLIETVILKRLNLGTIIQASELYI